MKNRVDYQEDVLSSIRRIPFLEKFATVCGCCVSFDLHAMNEYMDGVNGWPTITADSPISSADFNFILDEAEKRGDI